MLHEAIRACGCLEAQGNRSMKSAIHKHVHNPDGLKGRYFRSSA